MPVCPPGDIRVAAFGDIPVAAGTAGKVAELRRQAQERTAVLRLVLERMWSTKLRTRRDMSKASVRGSLAQDIRNLEAEPRSGIHGRLTVTNFEIKRGLRGGANRG